MFALLHLSNTSRTNVCPFRQEQVTRDVYLPVRSGNKGHELVHMTHREPIRVQRNGFLDLLSPQEVLNHPCHVATLGRPAHTHAQRRGRNDPTVLVMGDTVCVWVRSNGGVCEVLT